MKIDGQYPLCSSCRGELNKAVANAPGAKIVYTWPGGEWIAGG